MERQMLAGAAMITAIGFAPLVANADRVADRATLDAILGSDGALEDFHRYPIGADDANILFDADGNAISVLDWNTIAVDREGRIQGPGLIVPRVTYATGDVGDMQWNGPGYYGQDTRTYAGNGDFTEIIYDSFVTAMGVDVRIYTKFGADHRALVFDTNDELIGQHDFTLVGDPGESVFFGWENAAGIGRVQVFDLDHPWGAIIDNHQFGPILDCPGDIVGNGVVGFNDLLAILAAWGNAGGPEDLDMSGTVDVGDLLVVLANWGPCP